MLWSEEIIVIGKFSSQFYWEYLKCSFLGSNAPLGPASSEGLSVCMYVCLYVCLYHIINDLTPLFKSKNTVLETDILND